MPAIYFGGGANPPAQTKQPVTTVAHGSAVPAGQPSQPGGSGRDRPYSTSLVLGGLDRASRPIVPDPPVYSALRNRPGSHGLLGLDLRRAGIPVSRAG
jgi:hypothetical protein